jgi:putative intracellular protease/amidase
MKLTGNACGAKSERGHSTFRAEATLMNTARAVHVLVFDGFADWEPAHALAELRRWGKRSVRTVGFTHEPVVSMGGLRVMPDLALAEVRPEDVELLILPGGELWERESYPRQLLEALTAKLLETQTPVAAICAATIAVARTGALNDRRHTSNMPDYLPMHAREYGGSDLYVDAPAVRDRHLITASGLCDVDFARAIFAELGVFSVADEALWFDMFKYGRLPKASI